MKYVPPIGASDENESYSDGNPSGGVEGSAVSAAAVEHVMREVVNVIDQAGLDPDEDDLTQLYQAIVQIIEDTTNAFDIDGLTAGTVLNDADYMIFSDQSDSNNDKKVLLSVLRNFVLSNEVGNIAYFPGTSAPSGRLKCNGALVSRTTYAALWAYAQTSGNLVSEATWSAGQQGGFSTGDGSTTFRLPDGRAEFIRGLDDSRGVDSGRGIGTSQADALKSHHHEQGYASAGSGDGRYGTGTGSAATRYDYDGAYPGSNTTPGPLTSDTGGTETRPRNIALLACIKY